jgi:hypothetical protein
MGHFVELLKRYVSDSASEAEQKIDPMGIGLNNSYPTILTRDALSAVALDRLQRDLLVNLFRRKSTAARCERVSRGAGDTAHDALRQRMNPKPMIPERMR